MSFKITSVLHWPGSLSAFFFWLLFFVVVVVFPVGRDTILTLLNFCSFGTGRWQHIAALFHCSPECNLPHPTPKPKLSLKRIEVGGKTLPDTSPESKGNAKF